MWLQITALIYVVGAAMTSLMFRHLEWSRQIPQWKRALYTAGVVFGWPVFWVMVALSMPEDYP